MWKDGGGLGRAATWGRPYGQIGTFRGGRLIAAPTPVSDALLSLRRGRSQIGPRAHTVRPYGGNAPGALVRQSQARLWNRTGLNFPRG